MAERPTPDLTSPAMRAALLRGLTTRRSLMTGAFGVGASVALAACGSAPRGGTNPSASGAATPTAKAAQDMSDSEKVVNWSNWSSYIDVSEDEKSRPSLDAFTKETGIKVNYTEDYNDNDEFYAKVRPLLEAGEDTGRDVWCSTDWMVARLIRQGYVQQLDYANIPNGQANLEDSLKNVEFDPGRKFSLPWQSGFAGIAYNLDATGGKKIETMTQLLTDPSLKGKVTLLSEMRDTVGLVLCEMGKDPSNFTKADFDAAIEMIQKAKDAGQLKGFTGNDYTDGLTKGDIAACVAWTGDVVQLQFENEKVQYVLPQAGFTLWSDNFVIPAMAKHKKNAEKLIDYYYQPAVMAEVEAWVNYIPPVKGTKDELTKIDEELATNELIVPTPEVLSRAKVFRGLTAEEETSFARAFSDLTSS
ncbi:extracellular solute-binding protein [Oryzobacter sp. R7]|uniref:polyamine ABC transporter substrate-binding protein n=1 Tax=Oryzobacter faecalis TaxID=3388656 RepID=UPI00398D49EF